MLAIKLRQRLGAALLEGSLHYKKHAACSSSFGRPFTWSAGCAASKLAEDRIYSPNTSIEIAGKRYETDDWTNIPSKIIELSERNLLFEKGSPLMLLRRRIEDYFYNNFRKRLGQGRSPAFSVHTGLSPVVTPWENFDSLLTPKDHISRSRSDNYYVNAGHLLRAHTSAHQHSLIASGVDQFLVFGDCYRRDTIDSTHFPVFHQVEGVHLFSVDDLFPEQDEAKLFVDVPLSERPAEHQQWHTFDAAMAVGLHLRACLEDLTRTLFGADIEMRWVECYFPFTHPSWELEVRHKGDWLECLGCGIVEQPLLNSAGAPHKVGWAFGIGLERLAMRLYDIPDIRLFWSTDSGFTNQFDTDYFHKNIVYTPVSKFPQCVNSLSFWLPDGEYSENDFYDLVRSVGGDQVEQVTKADDFVHPKTQRRSQCFDIVYRHMEKVLTQKEVNEIHSRIEIAVREQMGAEVR